MRTTLLLLTAALATLLTAPIAQAKPPASLNDCQAYIQFVSQVYHYTSTCGETHGGKNVAALVERASVIRIRCRHQAAIPNRR